MIEEVDDLSQANTESRIEVEAQALPEVKLLRPRIFRDDRGFFFESWSLRVFNEAVGSKVMFVQDNHSASGLGVLRGLHYQIDHPQGKLVRAIRGAVFDVAVDLRRSSPRFGQWVGAELSEENRQQLWIPPGFGHGFLALSDRVELLYKATEYYSSTGDRSIRWNDADIGIIWPTVDGDIVLSEKDRDAPTLRHAEVYE